MKQDPCIPNCKYISDGICSLYGSKLANGYKCNECMERELSCSIDMMVMDIQSLYKAFCQETSILFNDLNILVDKRKSIYTEDTDGSKG